jgi:hypothetical protein
MDETQLLVEQFKHFNIEIYGTYENPLFKANDIGDLLEIKHMKSTIRNFDKDEVHSMHLTDSSGRNQEMNMLTEQGLYKMLMISRKHFSNCSLEHIKFVFDKCNKFVNTIGSIRQSITEKEFTEKLGSVIASDIIVEKEKIIKKIVYKTKFIPDYSHTSQLSDFDIDELLSHTPQNSLIQEIN